MRRAGQRSRGIGEGIFGPSAVLEAVRDSGAVFSSTAAGYMTVDGLSLTPSPGLYAVTAAVEVTADTAGREVRTAVRVNGAVQAERDGFEITTPDAFQSVALAPPVISVDGSDVVNVAIARDGGPPVTVSARNGELRLVRLS